MSDSIIDLLQEQQEEAVWIRLQEAIGNNYEGVTALESILYLVLLELSERVDIIRELIEHFKQLTVSFSERIDCVEYGIDFGVPDNLVKKLIDYLIELAQVYDEYVLLDEAETITIARTQLQELQIKTKKAASAETFEQIKATIPGLARIEQHQEIFERTKNKLAELGITFKQLQEFADELPEFHYLILFCGMSMAVRAETFEERLVVFEYYRKHVFAHKLHKSEHEEVGRLELGLRNALFNLVQHPQAVDNTSITYSDSKKEFEITIAGVSL